MRSDRDTARTVRSWLEEGVTALPDRVLDAVLDQVPATRQRRAWWPASRLFQLNKATGFSIAATAVVTLAVLGAGLLAPPGPNTGSIGETETPVASPMALPKDGTPLKAGTYIVDEPFPVRFTFEVRDGWAVCGAGSADVTLCPSGDRAVDFMIVDNVVADPCDRTRALLDPPVGASVEELVIALTNLEGMDATEPVDINVDGFAGSQFELVAPSPAPCQLDASGLGTWSVRARTNGVGPGEVNLIKILDVDGTRLVVAAAYQPGTLPAEISELRDIIDSIRVTP